MVELLRRPVLIAVLAAGCGGGGASPRDLSYLPSDLRVRSWEDLTTCSGGCTESAASWAGQRVWPSMPSAPDGPRTVLCGHTWRDLVSAPAHGDPWRLLAREYVAARINVADAGRDACHPPLITFSLDRATTLLEACTFPHDRVREALTLAGWLELYNLGDVGPGACGVDTGVLDTGCDRCGCGDGGSHDHLCDDGSSDHRSHDHGSGGTCDDGSRDHHAKDDGSKDHGSCGCAWDR